MNVKNTKKRAQTATYGISSSLLESVKKSRDDLLFLPTTAFMGRFFLFKNNLSVPYNKHGKPFYIYIDVTLQKQTTKTCRKVVLRNIVCRYTVPLLFKARLTKYGFWSLAVSSFLFRS